MAFGVIEEFFFSPEIYFVIQCGTYPNYGEDVEILVEFCSVFI